MSVTLKESAYHTIRKRLISGEFAPGSRLSDDSIAREIGISRSPVREAINQFVSEGLVEYRPRCGTFVKSFSKEEMSELWDVRIAMECYAASESIDQISSDELIQLAEINQEILELVKECRELPNQIADLELKSRFLQFDSAYHLTILKSTGNSRILKNVQDCRLMTSIFGPTHSALIVTSGMLLKSHQEHELIIKAISNSDRNNARDLTANHIKGARDRVLAHMDDNSVSITNDKS
jgi:DNA-binding GntR family transcriptional regulator